MKYTLASVAPVILAVLLAGCAPATVSQKQVVQVAYKGTLADGSVFSQSEAGKPLEFLVGGGVIIPALEKGILGMKVGEKRTVTVKAADAYGEYDQTAVQTVPRSKFPADLEVKVGVRYQMNTPGGPLSFVVTAITGNNVTVDFNHPLAGKDLTFEVTVLKIRPATKEELAKIAGPSRAAPAEAAPTGSTPGSAPAGSAPAGSAPAGSAPAGSAPAGSAPAGTGQSTPQQ